MQVLAPEHLPLLERINAWLIATSKANGTQRFFPSATSGSLLISRNHQRYANDDSLEAPSSVIISEWRGEIDWDAWYTSETRKQITDEIADHLEKEETHLVLSKQEGQMFLL